MNSPVFALAVDALFASALAVTARYCPQGGPAHWVRIVWRHPDEAFSPFRVAGQAPGRMLEIRVSRGTQALAEGDRFVVGTEEFTVESASKDARGLVWKVGVA